MKVMKAHKLLIYYALPWQQSQSLTNVNTSNDGLYRSFQVYLTLKCVTCTHLGIAIATNMTCESAQMDLLIARVTHHNRVL